MDCNDELKDAYAQLDKAKGHLQFLRDENERLQAELHRATLSVEKALEVAKHWRKRYDTTLLDVQTFVRFIYKILTALDYKNLMDGKKLNFGKVTQLVFSLMKDSSKITEPLKEDLPEISRLAEQYREVWEQKDQLNEP